MPHLEIGIVYNEILNPCNTYQMERIIYGELNRGKMVVVALREPHTKALKIPVRPDTDAGQFRKLLRVAYQNTPYKNQIRALVEIVEKKS